MSASVKFWEATFTVTLPIRTVIEDADIMVNRGENPVFYEGQHEAQVVVRSELLRESIAQALSAFGVAADDVNVSDYIKVSL